MHRIEPYDITEWVEQAGDGEQRELRQAVHTILAAIAHDPHLRANMIIKGGILLAVRYHSSRFTRDMGQIRQSAPTPSPIWSRKSSAHCCSRFPGTGIGGRTSMT